MADGEEKKLTLDDLAAGVRIGGRYDLKRELGTGGFGKVFLVRDGELEEDIALKFLRPEHVRDETQLARFKREVLLARRISHPNVCKIFDLGRANGLVYLSMEYIEGEELHGITRRMGPLAPRTGLKICFQICDGLEAAHREKIVHRDLKPTNVMLDTSGRVKLMDFGISKATDMGGLTATGSLVGTPKYIAPEQCRGKVGDHRSDLYSLGVMMYELFTNVPPFQSNTPMGVLFKHVEELPRPPMDLAPSLPASINTLILRCLEKRPEDRYQSAGEIAAEITRILANTLEPGEKVGEPLLGTAIQVSPSSNHDSSQGKPTLKKMTAPLVPAVETPTKKQGATPVSAREELPAQGSHVPPAAVTKGTLEMPAGSCPTSATVALVETEPKTKATVLLPGLALAYTDCDTKEKASPKVSLGKKTSSIPLATRRKTKNHRVRRTKRRSAKSADKRRGMEKPKRGGLLKPALLILFLGSAFWFFLPRGELPQVGPGKSGKESGLAGVRKQVSLESSEAGAHVSKEPQKQPTAPTSKVPRDGARQEGAQEQPLPEPAEIRAQASMEAEKQVSLESPEAGAPMPQEPRKQPTAPTSKVPTGGVRREEAREQSSATASETARHGRRLKEALQRARRFLEEGRLVDASKPDDALRAARRLLTIEPGNPEATAILSRIASHYRRIGLEAMKKKDFPAAVGAFRQGIQAVPGDSALQESLDLAIRQWEKTTATRQLLAEVDTALKNYDGETALRLLKQQLEDSPHDEKALRMEASAKGILRARADLTTATRYTEAWDLEKAAAMLELLLEKYGEWPEMVQADRELTRRQEAETALDEAGRFLAAAQLDEAALRLNATARDFPNHPRLAALRERYNRQVQVADLLDAANKLLRGGQFHEASRKIAAAAQLEPEDPKIKSMEEELQHAQRRAAARAAAAKKKQRAQEAERRRKQQYDAAFSRAKKALASGDRKSAGSFLRKAERLARTRAEASRIQKLRNRLEEENTVSFGRLKLRIRPWAVVFIDGKKIGNTPIPPQELSPGKHTVLLENKDTATRLERQVLIRAGEEVLLELELSTGTLVVETNPTAWATLRIPGESKPLDLGKTPVNRQVPAGVDLQLRLIIGDRTHTFKVRVPGGGQVRVQKDL